MSVKIIIYIVVGIGYFVYNIYKKTNAAKPAVQPDDYLDEEEEVYEPETSSASGSYKTIEDIINDLNDKGQAKVQPVVERAVNEGVDNPERTLKEVREEREEVERIQREFELRRKAALKKVQGKVHGKVRDSRRRKSTFNLRKAVLYRAVMERPKF